MLLEFFHPLNDMWMPGIGGISILIEPHYALSFRVGTAQGGSLASGQASLSTLHAQPHPK